MSSAHAAYFGQLQPHTLQQGDGEPATSGNENVATEPDSAFTPVGWPCGKKGQSLWLQVLKEHDYSTTRYIYNHLIPS
jgi:hypothetical protein